MHSEASSASDSSLLRSWCEERSESAFTELVRRYERLVIGAAQRRAGDRELARDVTQQVFAMLAAKARLLVGRPSIAGWLYRAAGHVAAQLARSDARRAIRHNIALQGQTPEAGEDQWRILEEALSRLGTSEREALLLHYFQDLSYSEMAAELRIGETAARKRVSRGLQKLGAALRKHGLGSPKALLAGAAALQASQPASATLAVSTIAGTSTVSTPLPLIFSAVMSHLPIKIAVCTAGLALLPLGYEWTANASLRGELTELQQQQARSLPTANLPSSPANDLVAARVELARLEAATKVAEARVTELNLFKERIKDELVVSLGSVEAMAKELGTTLRQMTELQALRADPQTYPPGSPEWQKRQEAMQNVQERVPKIFNVLCELPRFEREPAKAARFYATLVGESADLDDTTRAKLERPLQEWVTQLQRDGLALPQRPFDPGEAKADWDKRRIAAMHDISNQIQAEVPADKADRATLFRALMVEPNAHSVQEAFDIISGRPQ